MTNLIVYYSCILGSNPNTESGDQSIWLKKWGLVLKKALVQLQSSKASITRIGIYKIVVFSKGHTNTKTDMTFDTRNIFLFIGKQIECFVFNSLVVAY